jgi:hypothetical protein
LTGATLPAQGIEALLNHSGRFSSSFLVSGINNLLLAKEHILQWKPHLVIADLYSFISETHSSPPINPFYELWRHPTDFTAISR